MLESEAALPCRIAQRRTAVGMVAATSLPLSLGVDEIVIGGNVITMMKEGAMEAAAHYSFMSAGRSDTGVDGETSTC